MSKQPTLLRSLLRQHTIAALITLCAMLLVVLLIADHLALQSAAYSLARDLRNDDEQSLYAHAGQGRGGRIVLDPEGRVSALGEWQHRGYGRGPGWRQMSESIAWPQARAVIAEGERYGTSQLPWTRRSVVWAARGLTAGDGKQYVVVAWTPASGVRGAAIMTYYLIASAIAVVFLVNMGLLVYAIRGVTRTLNQVTRAGRRMVGGDFAVSIPPQSTAELDDLGTVITDLAQHLDRTLSELRDEQSRLVDLEQAQRRFVADASHELRAPLSAMTITLDAWHDGLLREGEKQEALATLRSEAKRLGRMVAQLLDLSRIQSGRLAMKLEPVDIREAVARVVGSMSDQHGAQVIASIPGSLACVVADREALHRVLRNLLDNATRFTPVDGSITVWAKDADDRAQIGVTDTGCGIPKAAVSRVWDRFARAERERSGEDPGTGLGLAIVKALVEAMDGEVGLESTEGEGTTAWVLLKRCEDVSET